MEKYGVDMVIANELKTRRSKVTIYCKDGKCDVLHADPLNSQSDSISERIIEHI